MKFIKCLYLFPALFCLFITAQLSADDYKEFSDLIKKEFAISSSGTVELSNKYGDIKITAGNSNTVSIEVRITIEAKNESKFKDVRDRIDIEFSNSPDRVKAVTEIKKKSGWKSIFGGSNDSYKIDYNIRLPSTVYLNIRNRYGDIQVPDMTNDLRIELKYGNGNIQNITGNLNLELGYVTRFEIGKIEGTSTLDLSYSKLSAESMNTVEMKSKYSEAEIRSAALVNSESNYDKLIFGTVSQLVNRGKYDRIDIGESVQTDIKTAYSTIQINSLLEEGILDTEYGKAQIKEISRGFKSLEIKSQYTSYDLNPCCNYNLRLDLKYVDVNYPESIELIERDKEQSLLKLRGKYGNGNSQIKAEMEYGKLTISNSSN